MNSLYIFVENILHFYRVASRSIDLFRHIYILRCF